MKKLYSVLLFLISVTLFAQTYTFTTFNTNNSSIAANNINDLKMSSSGTLWIATNYGLSKMVGNSFINYNTSNSNIGTEMLNKVAVAGTTVWISTYGYGIIRFNGTTFTNFNTNQQGMPNNTATGIATDGQGTLWMASSSGLSKFNGTTWTTYNTSNSQIGSNDVTSVAVDASDNVWVSAGGMLQKFSSNTFTSVTDGVAKILKITTTGIYVNTGDGLGKIVNNDYANLYWTSNSCLASCNVNAVGLDETNKVWLGLDSCGNYAGGVQNFTNCITYTTSNSGLPHNSITSLLVIDSNVIWAGTLEGGLVRMNKTDAPPCNPPTGLNVAQYGQTSAYLAWTAANPVPANGYIYRYNTVNTVTGAIESSTSQTGAGIDQLQPNTTYYWWVASACEPLTWVPGGSFTTEPAPSASGCTEAQYGLWPSANITPACTGSDEQIITNAWAGEYSNVNVLAGKQYTFTSSVSTDYITITDAAGTTVYASGPTPLSWASGTTSAVIRYYIHTNANCGSQNVNRTRSIKCSDVATGLCGAPSGPTALNITSNSVLIQWTAAVGNGQAPYDILFSQANTAPIATTTATYQVGATRRLCFGLNPSTTYYYWVRSVCSSTSKSAWIAGGSFTTIPALSCNGATSGLYPEQTFTPAYTGSNEVITASAFAGDYTNVNVMANKQYTFSSSTATDYLTITNTSGTIVYASGQTPVTMISGNISGVIRYYLHSNANCGDQTATRTRYIKGVNAPVSSCGIPTGLSVSNITSNSCRITWEQPATAPSNYDVYISSNSTWPEYNANPTASTMSSIIVSYAPLAASSTYYYWVRSVCGDMKSDWVSGGSFTTLPALACNGAIFGLYPEDTIMLQNTGAQEPVAYQSLASQYSKVGIAANKQYQFTSSIATDYITITNEAGTVVLAGGQTPVTWTSGNTPATVRFYLHANANCGPDDMPRNKFAKASVLGMNDYITDNNFKIYPNPTMGQFNVDTGKNIADQIMVFDNVGRVISTHIPVASKTLLTIDGLSDGVYYVRVQYQDRTVTGKLILKKN